MLTVAMPTKITVLWQIVKHIAGTEEFVRAQNLTESMDAEIPPISREARHPASEFGATLIRSGIENLKRDRGETANQAETS